MATTKLDPNEPILVALRAANYDCWVPAKQERLLRLADDIRRAEQEAAEDGDDFPELFVTSKTLLGAVDFQRTYLAKDFSLFPLHKHDQVALVPVPYSELEANINAWRLASENAAIDKINRHLRRLWRKGKPITIWWTFPALSKLEYENLMQLYRDDGWTVNVHRGRFILISYVRFVMSR